MSFGHIFSFVCAKEVPEPIRPLVTVNVLQERGVEVYFGFQKIEEIIKSYTEIPMQLTRGFNACTRKLLVYQNW